MELWEHQKKAILRGITEDELMLAMDPGVGKTRATIEILRRRFAQEKRLMRTLIFAPLIVLNNWKKEFAMYSKIAPHDILILNQPGKVREKKFIDFVKNVEEINLSRPRIVITNYEAAQMKPLMQLFHEWMPEILILDESHRCKNHESKRARAITSLSEKTRYRYLLTGTPILNSSMDLFQQFRILDQGKTFGNNFWSFRARWFEDENAGWSGKENYFPKYVPRPGTYDEFARMVATKSVKARKEECLDLPPLIKVDHFVELSTEQTKLYTAMKKDYLAFIEDRLTKESRAVVAQLAITKALRLQQIVSGFAKDDKGDIHHIENNPRLKALEELLEDLVDGHKVIVWACFIENYKMIAEVCKRNKWGYAELHGDISATQKQENIEKFTKDPECRILIGNQGAGGVGINLVEASYAIYYSRGFSLEHAIQSEARNYRGGSNIHEKITHINLVAKETTDELINDSLRKKEEIGQKILDWKL